MNYRALATVFLILCLGFLTACSSDFNTVSDPLSYDDIKEEISLIKT